MACIQSAPVLHYINTDILGMEKMQKKKIKIKRLETLLLMPLLIFSLLGQGLTTDIVLCIGESDHVAFELDCKSSKGKCPEAMKGKKVLDSTFASGLAIQETGSSCLDIPLLMSSSDPNISSVRYSRLLNDMIHMASISPPISQKPEITERFVPVPSFSPPATLLGIRSTVLLI